MVFLSSCTCSRLFGWHLKKGALQDPKQNHRKCLRGHCDKKFSTPIIVTFISEIINKGLFGNQTIQGILYAFNLGKVIIM